MGLWNVIIKSFKEPSIRKKILMTLLLILIFRIGCFIPVPGLASGALNGLAGTGLLKRSPKEERNSPRSQSIPPQASRFSRRLCFTST